VAAKKRYYDMNPGKNRHKIGFLNLLILALLGNVLGLATRYIR
jgi:hypothetical protein